MRIADPTRSGLTLLEVVVSLLIFGLSIVAIQHLVSLGSDNALNVKLQSRTSLLCQRKLAEVTIGEVPLGSTSDANYGDEKDITWTMVAKEAEIVGLWDVKITVQAKLPSGSVVSSQICQKVLDPSIRGSTLDLPPASAPAGTPTPNTDAAAK